MKPWPFHDDVIFSGRQSVKNQDEVKLLTFKGTFEAATLKLLLPRFPPKYGCCCRFRPAGS